MTDEPTKTEANGRDPETGRFLPGHPGGPGRPRGVDFRALVKERKGEMSLEDALVDVFDALLKASRTGDVAACRLLLDKLTDDTLERAGVTVRLTTGIPTEASA